MKPFLTYLQNATTEHAGLYKCVVSNTRAEINANLTLNIQVAPAEGGEVSSVVTTSAASKRESFSSSAAAEATRKESSSAESSVAMAASRKTSTTSTTSTTTTTTQKVEVVKKERKKSVILQCAVSGTKDVDVVFNTKQECFILVTLNLLYVLHHL